MSLQVRDKKTLGLATLALRIGDKRPILEAMGVAALSITARPFNTPGLRAAPWPRKKDGTPATLRKNQVLVRSWRIASVTNDAVVIGSDRPYAAVHQLGSLDINPNGQEADEIRESDLLRERKACARSNQA